MLPILPEVDLNTNFERVAARVLNHPVEQGILSPQDFTLDLVYDLILIRTFNTCCAIVIAFNKVGDWSFARRWLAMREVVVLALFSVGLRQIFSATCSTSCAVCTVEKADTLETKITTKDDN